MSFQRVLAAFSMLVAFATSATAHDECLITFQVGAPSSLGAFSASAYYVDAPGEFAGSGTSVQCQSLVPDFASKGDDVDAERKLKLSGIGQYPGEPFDAIRCTWLPTSRWPVVEDFELSELYGLDSDLNDVDLEISISSIDCESITTTTDFPTTTTTIPASSTTTLPDVLCGDFSGNGDIQVSDALGILRTSIGTASCPLCVCDVDGSGTMLASDALMALRIAVAIPLVTNCPGC